MSLCNIPVEPTDVCEHMIPKGLPCATCSELKSSREERLLSGKDQSIKLFKYFTHKFDKLEKWCTYVVELYSKKIGKLEGISDYIDKADQRIVNVIEQVENKLQNQINELNQVHPKKPHKCPVCKGSGYKEPYTKSSVLYIEQPCNSCEGKGIVWG